MLKKRKIGKTMCFMPDGEYSLCGMAFDGETGDDVFGEDKPLKNVREITCEDCQFRIDAVRQLLNAKRHTGET